MNQRITTLLLISVFLLSGMLYAAPFHPAHAVAPSAPSVGVWSNACASFNVSSTNPFCQISGLSFTPNSQFTIQINVTNAPTFNAFEFALYYDPHYLGVTNVDVTGTTGFPTVFGNSADALKSDFRNNPGTVYLSVVGLGSGAAFTGNGVLANIVFNITGTGVSPITMAAGMIPSSFAQDAKGGKPVFTELANTDSSGSSYYIGVDTSDGYFTNTPSKLGPVAAFTFSPRPAEEGRLVTFDASASFDPDRTSSTTCASSGIVRYVWDFGDGGSENNTVAVTNHPYSSPGGTNFLGNFTVRLTVVDCDNQFQGMVAQRVEIVPPPKHDVAIFGITASPAAINPGQPVTVRIIVKNQGTYQEVYNLTVSYGPPTTLVRNVTNQGLAPVKTATYQYTIDTTNLSPNTYSVVATLHIPFANDTSDETGRAIFVVQWPTNSPFLYLLSGGAGAVVLASVGGLLVRRRRLRLAELDDSPVAKPKRRSRSR